MFKSSIFRWKCIASAVLMSVSLVGCGSASSSSPTTSSPPPSVSSVATPPSPTSTTIDLSKVTLKVGYSSNRGQAPQALRLQSKAFNGTPYTISWVEFPSGDQGLQALNAGATDLQLQMQTPNAVIAQANAKTPWTSADAPFSVIGAFRYASTTGIDIIVSGGSGINSVADLKGKKVAFSKGSSSNYYWLVAARAGGLKTGDVEIAQLTLSDAKVAFKTGAVDALVAFDYNLAPLVRTTGAKVIASSGKELPLYSLLAARQGLLADAAVKASVADFAARLSKSEQWQQDNVNIVRGVYETIDKIDPLDSEAIAVGGIETPVPVDDSVVAAVQDQADVFFAEGVVATKADVRILFDRTFATP